MRDLYQSLIEKTALSTQSRYTLGGAAIGGALGAGAGYFAPDERDVKKNPNLRRDSAILNGVLTGALGGAFGHEIGHATVADRNRRARWDAFHAEQDTARKTRAAAEGFRQTNPGNGAHQWANPDYHAAYDAVHGPGSYQKHYAWADPSNKDRHWTTQERVSWGDHAREDYWNHRAEQSEKAWEDVRERVRSSYTDRAEEWKKSWSADEASWQDFKSRTGWDGEKFKSPFGGGGGAGSWADDARDRTRSNAWHTTGDEWEDFKNRRARASSDGFPGGGGYSPPPRSYSDAPPTARTHASAFDPDHHGKGVGRMWDTIINSKELEDPVKARAASEFMRTVGRPGATPEGLQQHMQHFPQDTLTGQMMGVLFNKFHGSKVASLQAHQKLAAWDVYASYGVW